MNRQKLAAVLKDLDHRFPTGSRDGRQHEEPPDTPTDAELERFDAIMLESRRTAAKTNAAKTKKVATKPRTRAAA